MEIRVKRRKKDDIFQDFDFPILEYTILNCSPTLYLIRHSWVTIIKGNIKDTEEKKSYKIDKIQFIANCKTEEFENVLVVFYIGDYGTLQAQPIDFTALNKPNKPFDTEYEFTLIDYKSYTDLCEITGEAKVSFSDYVMTMTGENDMLLKRNYEAFNFHSFDIENGLLKFELNEETIKKGGDSVFGESRLK